MQSAQLAVSELWMAFVLIGILCLYKKEMSSNKNTKYLLFVSIIRLFSDAAAWYFDSFPGPLWGLIIRISNYFTFIFNDIILALFSLFLWDAIKRPKEKQSFFLRIYLFVAGLSILSITLNLHFGWFYTIDNLNKYHRGQFHGLCFISSFLCLASILWHLIRYSKRFTVRPKVLCYLFVLVMTGSTIYEFMNFGLAIQIYAEILASIIAFFYAELEVREKLHAAKIKLEISQRKADAANKAKTIFLNNMSHDIRTPMNAILGFSKLMSHQINNPDKLREYITKINSSGDYLLSVITNVLEMARIDSGKEQLCEKFVCLNNENESVIPMLQAEIGSKKINLTFSGQIDHKYVFADMAKNKQITMNLLSNAIKYTPEGGSVHMDFSEVHSDREGYACFVTTVSDTGIGMSKEFIKHIFEEFSRERNTTECKIHGTGLGMAIVKKLVDLIGGTIEIESEIGKGSTFKVTTYHKIVENPEEFLSAQKNESISKEISLKDMRILLVEDNELNAEIAASILEQKEIKVDIAEDGLKCIEKLTNTPSDYYDLIFMDIQMPVMDGYEATRKIRLFDDEQKAKIPIIAMTANAFEEDRAEAFRSGMNDFITKPVGSEKLINAVYKVASYN